MKKGLLVVLTVAIAVLFLPHSLRADTGVDGAAVYKAKCAMCHGPDGKGQTAMGKSLKLRDLGSAEVQKLTDAELNKIITDGKGKMPAYKSKLDQASIDAVIAFIRTLKK
ncbi:MAG TPA: cytochrome c, partial [Thermoanaerobaculia bacterium]|nr:cytochrome c [Thermoanaerobaculia bacterium]